MLRVVALILFITFSTLATAEKAQILSRYFVPTLNELCNMSVPPSSQMLEASLRFIESF